MADKIPQLDEAQPLIQGKSVSSHSEGHEAFAKTLGSLATKSMEIAQEIHEEKSNAMLMTSMANVDKLNLSTQESILRDPANSMKTIDGMQYTLDTIDKNTPLNKSDRKKLQKYINDTYNGAKLNAIRAEIKQSQIGAAFEYEKNWPYQLNALHEAALRGDEKEVETLRNSMIDYIETLVKSGARTPHQAVASLQSMTDQIALAHETAEFMQKPELHNAKNYHAIMNKPFDKNKTVNTEFPKNESTVWKTSYNAENRSFNEIQDDLYSHKMPSVHDYEQLSAHQREQLKLERQGIVMADALIDHNAPMTEVNERLKELEGKNSYQAQAERKSLKQYVDDSTNGNSQRLMARTSLGGQIVQDYNATDSYLRRKLENVDKNNIGEINSIKADIAKNKNDYVNKSIAYADAHHIPVVHPIPYEDIQKVESSFKLGSDPSIALSTLNNYSKQNQMFFAEQLKDPHQRVVMSTIALSGDKNTDAEKLDFISANQPGRYKELDLKSEDAISENYLRNQINTNIRDAIRINNIQNPPQIAAILNERLIRSGVNYSKFLSEKQGLFTMEKEGTFNGIKNVTPSSQFIKNSYEVQSGANYIINKKQNNIDPKQMDTIAQYAINEGDKYRRSLMSESQFQYVKMNSPLSVYISPTNRVIAKNIHGDIVYSEPLTEDLKVYASKEVKNYAKQQKEMIFTGIKPKGRKDIDTAMQFIKV